MTDTSRYRSGIFISYSRSDSKFVDYIEKELESRGFVTWVDQQRLSGGDDWALEVQAALDASLVVLFVISPEALASTPVRMELRSATAAKKRLIPLLVRDPAAMPIELAGIDWVDFRIDFAQGLRKLINTLTDRGTPSSSTLSVAPSRDTLSFTAIPDAVSRDLEIAVVRQMDHGDFTTRFYAGTESMAREFGISLKVYAAFEDQVQLVDLFRMALNDHPSAIIVEHGDSTLLEPEIARALAVRVPVVTFDLVVNLPDVTEVAQDDFAIGAKVAIEAINQIGSQANVLYLNDDCANPRVQASRAPLAKRDRAWEDAKWWFKDLHCIARVGAISHATVPDTQRLVEQQLDLNPEITAIIAMWDEFAKAAVQAVRRKHLADKVSVFAVDISDADISLMIEDASPWKVTIATDPYSIGRLMVRAATARIAGEKPGKVLQVEPIRISREYLIRKTIKTMEQLVAQVPQLRESALCWYPWMASMLVRRGFSMPSFVDTMLL